MKHCAACKEQMGLEGEEDEKGRIEICWPCHELGYKVVDGVLIYDFGDSGDRREGTCDEIET